MKGRVKNSDPDPVPDPDSQRQKTAAGSSGSKQRQLAAAVNRFLAPSGRGDSPPPASRQWLTSTHPSFSAVACKSLPAASSATTFDQVRAMTCVC
jgi:hypothetical protein